MLGISKAAWAQFSSADAAAAIRLALERGAESAVDLLGRADGFLGNPKVKIPLPGYLEDAAGLLKATGQGKKVDELVTAMNRAAEAAVPEARTMLVSAATSIRVDDALKIVRGSNTAVTVTAKALDGMYVLIGEEEKKMRADPVKTGSDLLKKVFGG